MVTLKDATLAHGRGKHRQIVLDNITLELRDGERVALLGRSGVGKSTLLDAIRLELGEKAAWCPQEQGLVGALSVYHNIYMGRLERSSTWRNLRNLIRPDPTAWQAIAELCHLLGIADVLRQPVESLSGGQRSRVAIARALYQARPHFLGDEPVASVDPHQGDRLLTLITERHGLCLIALHQRELALSHFDRVIGLTRGRVALDADTSSLTLEQLDALYRS
ncbi:phosphonate ABC transporter ATP-binding protein [Kushneria phosphatilytica]|uniref:ATP-binding cassette domain-containing protein n=1 Tax=Kushneria phosphatilytica TaxID=657387 RepID=A0A1S1NVR9_9GAMM|nr:ATP-binding cassette domain-containing protein [Kushneria phosphatilytica]OHV10636.1 phosphonate ABC transporter ATP-binding protein [Kushneria phosphatilytica]QEL12865.1 ATP-binding cassette domain-containing protein [Kushneria phosphatilytica]